MSGGTFVLGALNGLTIGLLAVGLVLVYKSNRFLNLAHAQMGALSALLVAKAVSDWGWNYAVAFVGAVALAAVTGLVIDRFIVTPVRKRTDSPMRLLLLSLGVSQLLLALTFVPAFSPDTSRTTVFPQPFDSTLRVGGVRLTGMDILTAILVPLLVAGLAAFMRWSVYGKQVRAAANNADAAQLCGISVERVSAVTWALAGAFSGVSAVLQAPQQASFNVSALGPYLLMLTLGAAAFGAFVSLPGALLGGLLLGLVNQAVAAQTGDATSALLTVFVLILAIVFVRGRAIARVFELSGAPVEDLPVTRVPAALRTRPFVRHQPVVLGLGALVALAVWPLLPWFSTTSRQFLLSLVLVYAIVGVALTVLLGWGGQVSLGNFAVLGLGAYLTARWSADWTLTALVLVVGAAGAVAMVVVGLPALRIRGLTLALTTLGFAVIAHDWLYHQSWVAGGNALAATVQAPSHGPRLGAPGDQRAVYYVALALLALAVLTTSALRRSAPGRLLLAVRDNERASAAFGVTPATVKLSVLAVSGFFSAAAGVVWAISWRAVSTTQFSPELSMAVLAIPVIGGLGSIGGAVAAAVVLYSSTFFIGPAVQGVFGDLGQNLGFSLFLAGSGVVAVIMQFPHGIAGAAQALWQRVLDRQAERLGATGADAGDLPAPVPELADAAAVETVEVRRGGLVEGGLLGRLAVRAQRGREAGDDAVPLAVHGVRMAFGGIVALEQPDIVVRPGEIVGLIGTNGAGKTTLLNVVSGVLRPDEGSVMVFGHEVVDLPPDFRAALGLGRSFQDASLFAGLTVRETIQVALSQREKVGMVSAMLAAPWVRLAERRLRREADDILGRFGLLPWADARTRDLSTGTRRICDLAAQVAARPALILLDEPTAGVAQREAEAFGPLLRRIRDELGCAVLIVEHDMPLLMGLCDRLYALEAGQVIAEGPPAQIREDPRVVASYLGNSDAAIGRSGAAAQPRPARRPVQSSAPDGPLLRVDDVDFSYGQLQVLFEISLEVHRGEALALLGTNGAGKSTLLRVVSGLEQPDAGNVSLGERDITGMPATRLASEGLALISGGRSVFTDMTVQENLQMQALQIRKQRRLVDERTEQVLATFPRLAERLSQPAGKLSGGEQQQLALARALLLDPEVLCIDELSLGLAPVVVGELLDIVRQLHAGGTTLVVVEQSLNIAAALCERAVFLEKGAVRFTGRTADLLEQDDIARAVFFGGAAGPDPDRGAVRRERPLQAAHAGGPR